MVKQDPNNAEASYRSGILFMLRRSFDQAQRHFAEAVAVDPSRPEYYSFWSKCLREQGKMQEAATRFHSAPLRNEIDPSIGYYRLKFWLCKSRADLEQDDGVNAQIDAVVARLIPFMEALIADAAREIKTRDFKGAMLRLTQACALIAPGLFRAFINDPIFRQERRRPEIAQVFNTQF